MSSRLRGRVARAPGVTVVTVGDSGVGKTALIHRFTRDTFTQSHQPTSFERYQQESCVAARRVEFTMWDTSGSRQPSTNRSLAYREADVVLLCYRVSSPSSLFSAINHWVPEVRLHAPATPLLLVGCAADLRREGGGCVSPQEALARSQQVDALMYVETSARTSGRGVASVMEVAALASLGQFSPPPTIAPRLPPSPLPPSPLVSKKHRQRSLSLSRRAAEARESQASHRPELGLTREGSRESLYTLEPAPAFWEQFSPSPSSPRSPSSPSLALRGKTGSLSSVSMRSKSSTLSSTRSDASMQSVKREPVKQPPINITTCRTPKTGRKTAEKAEKGEKMITIKCQRLTADKTYEEVEIEVPAPVYETMQGGEAGQVREKAARGGGLGNKIKCLFSKTAQ